MKRIILMLTALLSVFAAEAKIVKITFADGSQKVMTSSELSSIDFNDNGTLTITTYDGKVLETDAVAYDLLDIDDEEAVFEEREDTLYMDIDVDGVPVKVNGSRAIKRLNFVYPSTDPFGNAIALSGTIMVPRNIWDGKDCSEGVLLFNHYTITNRNESPTHGHAPLESIFMANPLKPNYIVVESDFYGFGATERFPQAFLQGTNNARASLDCLLAARRILQEMGIDYGPLTFNVGYSSGGFDALATQKLRDMEYADVVSFDKTFAGGSPSDIRLCYREYVRIDSTAYNAVPLLLMVSTKETQQLDISYEDVFQPAIAARVDELIISKNYSSWPVCDSIGREKKIHEILGPAYCDLTSQDSKFIQDLLAKLSICTDDWTPDATQRLYIMHSRGDNYVPVKSARGIISHLKGYGFKPSIVPGKTNLQTNFVVRNMGHLTATLVYAVQTVAALKAWPLMYTDGELNPYYAELVSKDMDLVATMRQLDAMGIDCRTIIKELAAKLAEMQSDGEDTGESPASFNYLELMMKLNEVLNKQGLTLEEINEMASDSGIDLIKLILDFVTYMNEKPAEDEQGEGLSNARGQRLLTAVKQARTPIEDYEQQLRDWLQLDKLNNK